MAIRVFFLLTSLFCACNFSEDQEANRVDKEVEGYQKGEIEEVVEYHPNGAVKLRGKSQDGKRIGRWESFYPNGYRWSESVYRDGYRQGEATTYFPNGMMRYQGRYYNGERAGVWTFYDTTGVVIQKIDMDLPQKEGIDTLGID